MLFNKKNESIYEESNLSKRGFKGMDKIYILTAFVLLFIWFILGTDTLSDFDLKSLSPTSILSSIKDKSENKKFAENQLFISRSASFVDTDDKYVYYANPLEGGIVKRSRDGSEMSVLLRGSYSFVKISGQYLYFISQDGGLGRVKMGGFGEFESINTGSPQVYSFSIYGDYLYFSNEQGIHRTDLTGNNKKTLSSMTSSNLALYGKWIYFTGHSLDTKIYRVSIDGGEAEEVADRLGKNDPQFGVYKDWIYYTSGNHLYRVKLGSTKPLLIKENVHHFTIERDKLYYTTGSESLSHINGQLNPRYSTEMCTSNLDGSNELRLKEGLGMDLIYIRDNVYCAADVTLFIISFKELVQ